MNYLFVVAHPDDESDAAGGTIHKLIQEGHNVASWLPRQQHAESCQTH